MKQWQTQEQVLKQVTGRTLAIEHRGEYGWFIVEGGNTLCGFQTKRLLLAYLKNVLTKGRLYTPTARECYR